MVNKSQNFKDDFRKPNPLLLEVGCPRALLAVVQVLGFGASKYKPNSWMEVEAERFNAAARRHRIERDLGVERDPESGFLHLAHEAANILFQLEIKCRENSKHSIPEQNLES
jgi:hypothetical protein